MEIIIIVAQSKNRVIGNVGSMPWRLSNDLKHFKEKTLGHIILMGRKTFESIGKALPGRVNLIVSRSAHFSPKGTRVFNKIETALDYARTLEKEKLFVIGGGEIYQQLLPRSEKIILTQIKAEIEGDTFFPELKEEDWEIKSVHEYSKDDKNDFDFTILEYLKRKP